MRFSLVALLALASLASASNTASACEFYACAISDDMYPPGEPSLDPAIEDAVHARLGFGLSQAGFYNDPAVALEYRRFAAAPPPPPGAWIEPGPVGGPAIVYGGWGPSHGRVRYAHRHGGDQGWTR